MASTRLTRTASGGSNQIYTASCWVKRTKLGTTTSVLTTGNGGADSNARMLIFDATDKIEIAYYNAGFTYQVTTNRLFRDTSAWYHLVVAVDTTQTTASDRIKIYVNGVQETSFATSSYPSLNATFNYNSSAQYIGDLRGSGIYGEFLLSHFNYIDGLAYDADTFGETDATTGIWKPKTAPSVTYGTNGFFLKGENSGSLGTDSSGNANNFTVNGTPTQTVDTPSNVFATMNPLFAGDANITYSNGNLKLTATAEAQKNAVSTIAVSSGKWYCEMVSRNGTNYPGFGIMDSQSVLQTSVLYLGSSSDSYCMFQDGNYYNNGSASSTGITWGVGSIMGIAIDLDSATKTIKFYKDGAEVHSATITTPANGYVFAASHNANGTISEINFGNGYFGTTAVASATTDESGLGIFEYDVPTGYYALCTKNINEQEYS